VGLSPSAVTVAKLFSESASRFLVEVTPEQLGAFESHMREQGIEDIFRIGQVTNTSRFIVQNGNEELLDVSVDELQTAWKGGQA
jgi:phosphoribosylformylglycinamidine synthase